VTDRLRPDEIVRRIEGAEILAFPRAAAPSAGAPAATSRDHAYSQTGASREDAGAGGSGGGDAGDDAGDLDRRLALRPLTDLGNAERFAARFRGQLMFCRVIGWLAWDGKHWQAEDAEERVTAAVQDTVRAIQDEADALQNTSADFLIAEATKTKPEIWRSDQVRAWGRASEAASHMAAVDKHAIPKMAVSVHDLDRDPMLINVQNGTLAVRKTTDGSPYITLRSHDPADLITKISPVAFDPEADCPKYDAFLARVQPAGAMREFLHRWIGLSLTGDVGEQKMTFHYGKGRNGKGVCINTASFIAGDYADSIGIETFLDSGKARAGGQATPDIADLPGVRFLTTSEPKKGATLDEGFVKLITGGDPIKARHLNRGFFEFFPQCKLTIQGNYRPKISGTDDGIWGRVILVPWSVFIPPEDRDPHLTDTLKTTEASGILNHYLDGLCDWLDHGLRVPAAVVEATDRYRSDSDPLGRFLDACTRPEIGQRVQASEMHALYVAWAKVNGEAEWSAKGLGNALRERGLAEKKSSVQYWLDVMLIAHVADFVDGNGRPMREQAADETVPPDVPDWAPE
jgi:putative DNA primase/helicase